MTLKLHILPCLALLIVTWSIASAQSDTIIIQNRKTHKYGFIAGRRLLIPARFDSVKNFTEGLAAVQVQGRWGYVNAHGLVVIPAQFSHANGFSGGHSPVAVDGHWGMIDRVGNWVILPKYMYVYQLDDGSQQFQVETETGDGVMDLNGRWIATPYYQYLSPLQDGIRQGEDSLGNRGFIDAEGNVAIPFQFSDVGEFSEGLSPATLRGESLQGYINREGNWAIAPQFDFGMGFARGYAVVRGPSKGDQMGVIDWSGKYILSPDYEQITNCRNSWFLIKDNGKYTYLRFPEDGFRREGLDGAVEFRDGFAFVCQGCKLVTKEGRSAFEGGRWAIMDTLGALHALRRKQWQADFSVNSPNVIMSSWVYRKQYALWLKRSRVMTITEFQDLQSWHERGDRSGLPSVDEERRLGQQWE